jgi:hypothetical protein
LNELAWVAHHRFLEIMKLLKLVSFLCVLLAVTDVAGQLLIPPKSAIASSSLAGYSPQAAIDANTTTFWGAGVGAATNPYIEIDYGSDNRMSKVELVVNQWPAGQTVHVVTGLTSGGQSVSLGTLSGNTTDGQTLTLPINSSTPIRYLRVQTTASPSWVSWYEIRAYSTPVTTGSLTTNLSTCTVASGALYCAPAPVLNASITTGYARVWVASAPANAPEVGGWVFDTTSSSSSSIPWIRQGQYVFELREGATASGRLLSSTTLSGTSLVVVAPSCTSVAPQATTTNATSGTFRVYVNGVANATSVRLPTWGDAGGQDDLVSYTGINAGGGQWYADINLANHKAGNPEYGNFNTHAYMSNASVSDKPCGATTWTRTQVTQPPVNTDNLIANGGFESPATSTYVYPASSGIPNWSASGGVAIQRNGSAWGAQTAPEGLQTAVLQSASNLSTIVTAPSTGTYSLKFHAAARTNWGAANSVDVKVNGVTLYNFTPNSGAFTQQQLNVNLATGSNTIMFTGTTASGDNSTFIDDVRLTLVASVTNPSPKYFSYHFVGDGGLTNNYVSDISDHTNLAWAVVDPTNQSDMIALKSFIDSLPASKKVMLAGSMFFGFSIKDKPLQFLADYQTRWNLLVGPTGLSATQYQRVAAIYIADEPEDPSSVSAPTLTDAQFATARALIQSVRPAGSAHTPAIATVYSYLVTVNNPTKPPVGIASMDWVGFDCYPVSSSNSSWSSCVGTSMAQQLANLKSLRTSPPTQKIMLVAETAIHRNFANDPITPTRRTQAIANLKQMRDILLNDNDVNGIVGFNYEGIPSAGNDPGWAGLPSLNDVSTNAKLLGKCAIGTGACNY